MANMNLDEEFCFMKQTERLANYENKIQNTDYDMIFPSLKKMLSMYILWFSLFIFYLIPNLIKQKGSCCDPPEVGGDWTCRSCSLGTHQRLAFVLGGGRLFFRRCMGLIVNIMTILL